MRRFLTVVVGLALVAVLLWWSALINPRVASAVRGGSFDVASFVGSVETNLTNEGPTGITVVDVVLQSPGVQPLAVEARDGDDLSGRHLSPGEGVEVVLGYQTDGCLHELSTATAVVAVTTRTALGIARTQRFPAADALHLSTCPFR